MTRPLDASVPPLDAEYDLRSAFPDYVHYFEDWAVRSRGARQRLNCLLDVPYGPGPRDRVDFFPAPTPIAPLLVYVHGGYWRSLDKSDFSFLAFPFIKNGTSLALINYDLFPGTTMSKLVAQVRHACAWIAVNAGRLGVAYTELHLAGWSAGAHLVAMVLCSGPETSRTAIGTPRVSSMLALSGVYDLQPILETSANADLRLDKAEAQRNSPINLQPTLQCPIVMMWGERETRAFRQQSSCLAEVWRAKGAGVRSMQVPGLHHYALMNALGDDGSAVFETAAGLLRANNGCQ